MTLPPWFNPNAPIGGLSGLGGLPLPPRRPTPLRPPSAPIGFMGRPVAPAAHIDRRVFFSFHFDDVMRVNNVRRRYEFETDGTKRRFHDSSLWEAKKLTNPEAIKGLIRYGVGHTSAVCVLAGTGTWDRRWVRYEIARAVVDERGLLVVHLNGINHHLRGAPDPIGPNPLRFMGLYKKAQSPQQMASWHLCELTERGWLPYQDYTQGVLLPRYLNGNVEPCVPVPLSLGTGEYCYDHHKGSSKIAMWINEAARAVGR